MRPFIVEIGKQFDADEEQVDLHRDGHDERKRVDHALADVVSRDSPDDL